MRQEGQPDHGQQERGALGIIRGISRRQGKSNQEQRESDRKYAEPVANVPRHASQSNREVP